MWGVKATTIVSSSVRWLRRRFTAEPIRKYLGAFDRIGFCAAAEGNRHSQSGEGLLKVRAILQLEVGQNEVPSAARELPPQLVLLGLRIQRDQQLLHAGAGLG